MEAIYQAIWELAKPYYEKGRPMDVDHIEWMMGAAEEVCNGEGIDKTIFIPLVILHDAGYAVIDNLPENTYGLDTRRAHMKAGAELAREILEKVHYDPKKIDAISHYVSIHDNWAFDDNELFTGDPLLGAFNDLDFMWMATPKGFPAAMQMQKRTAQEMLDYMVNNDKLVKRPLANGTTRRLFQGYVEDRQKEINEK